VFTPAAVVPVVAPAVPVVDGGLVAGCPMATVGNLVGTLVRAGEATVETVPVAVAVACATGEAPPPPPVPPSVCWPAALVGACVVAGGGVGAAIVVSITAAFSGVSVSW
jgi:hypothetical protein